jgi:hypothetical protein
LRKRPRTKDVKGIARVGANIVAEARIRFMIADHDDRVHAAPEHTSELTLTHSV